jgi:hypothetical protein
VGDGVGAVCERFHLKHAHGPIPDDCLAVSQRRLRTRKPGRAHSTCAQILVVKERGGNSVCADAARLCQAKAAAIQVDSGAVGEAL